jgi:hypothetical protein
MDCPRDFKVVKNIKYKSKQKVQHTNKCNQRDNIADEILEVLSMINDHPYVQTFIHHKDKVPSIICYTNEQMKDLKHFLRNGKKQPI